MTAPSPRVAALLRSPALVRAGREVLTRDPSADVLVVIGAGVPVPELVTRTRPAGDALVAPLPLASALEVARARSPSAAEYLAQPPPIVDGVRVLYLDVARACFVCSLPARVLGRSSGTDCARGAA